MIGFNTSGVSTDDARQESLIAGLIQRFNKRLPGSGQAEHQRRLSGVYCDAIELNGGSLVSAGGFTTTSGLVGFLALSYFSRDSLHAIVHDGDYFLLLVFLATAMPVLIIGIYFEMFSPSEQPIYFDRARRKIYYVHHGRRKRFILFGPSTVEARAADWSLVDCELHAKLGGSTTSMRRTYHLVFLVRASEMDPTIVDWFVLPQVEFPSAMWEYIRGYMEAGVPPLTANEVLPIKGKGFDMIEALRQRRKDYWRDWKEFPFTQLWQHPVLPFFVVFFIVNRFVVWTAQTVAWPQDIKDALGAPMTEADVEADATHKLRASSET